MISKLVYAVLAGLIAAFVTYLILGMALSLPTQPWVLLVGILVALGTYFSGSNFPFNRS